MAAIYNKNGIANILYMGEISNIFGVAMDTVEVNFIKVYLNCNNILKFYKYGTGIYYHDTSYASQSHHKFENKICFLSATRDNKIFYNNKESKAADDSREL